MQESSFDCGVNRAGDEPQQHDESAIKHLQPSLQELLDELEKMKKGNAGSGQSDVLEVTNPFHPPASQAPDKTGDLSPVTGDSQPQFFYIPEDPMKGWANSLYETRP